MSHLLEYVLKSVLIILFLLTGFAYMTLAERRVLAKMQFRLGPNRVGPGGLFQPLADGLKLLFKEALIPAAADKPIFILAPMISVVVALVTFAVIPLGTNTFNIFGQQIDPWLANVNIGILYMFSISSLGVYGIVLGGWSSGNKYSLMGAIRSGAQMISYELSLGLSIMGVIMLTGSLNMVDIVKAQGTLPFIIPQFLGFCIYAMAGIAETNRAPFDLPEAEQELVAGYHTEYSGFRWALYFMAEYTNMITVSAIATTLFLGGGNSPIPAAWVSGIPVVKEILLSPVIWFLLKVALFLFSYIWLRATLPRLRYDRLMRLGWQVLVPLALLNLVGTAIYVALR